MQAVRTPASSAVVCHRDVCLPQFSRGGRVCLFASPSRRTANTLSATYLHPLEAVICTVPPEPILPSGDYLPDEEATLGHLGKHWALSNLACVRRALYSRRCPIPLLLEKETANSYGVDVHNIQSPQFLFPAAHHTRPLLQGLVCKCWLGFSLFLARIPLSFAAKLLWLLTWTSRLWVEISTSKKH